MLAPHLCIVQKFQSKKRIMKTISKIAMLVATVLIALSATAQKKSVDFTIVRVIEAPADKVWAVVGEDFGAIANSHPKIVSSEYVEGTLQAGEGAMRQCNLNESGSKYLKEKQINYDPANRSFDVQVYHVGGLPMDMDVKPSNFKVVPIDDNSCKLVLDMHFRTKPAFVGSLAKGKFKSQMADYALAVEHHVTTGEVVNKENFKRIKKERKG